MIALSLSLCIINMLCFIGVGECFLSIRRLLHGTAEPVRTRPALGCEVWPCFRPQLTPPVTRTERHVVPDELETGQLGSDSTARRTYRAATSTALISLQDSESAT